MFRTASIVALVAAFVVVACGVACQVAQSGPPIAIWMASFLFAFGLSKVLVGADKLAALGAVAAGGPDPRADFASPFVFWAYIIGKFAVFVVACCVGAYLLQHPAAFILR